MEPTKLQLYYEGNYVGKSQHGTFEFFTFGGKLYAVRPWTDTVFIDPAGYSLVD